MTADHAESGGVSRRRLLASLGVLAAASACTPGPAATGDGSSGAPAAAASSGRPSGGSTVPASSRTPSTAPTDPPVSPASSTQVADSTTSTGPAVGGPATGGPAAEVMRGAGTRPQVALTFHGAGDPAIARDVLDVIAARGARITVMVVGTWLDASPELAGVITAAGHELGNHTWTHPILADLAEDDMAAEINRCRDLLVALTGGPGTFFRPSSAQHATDLVRQVAGRSGYATCLSYDVDSTDWTDPGPRAIRQAVAAATAGSVVSLHFGHPGTVDALPGVLDDLAARGLAPVTASTLLAP